jgi:putative membrane-bound dehydrogenase-like protein
MKLLASLLILAFFALPTSPQDLTPEAAVKKMKTAEGFEVSLVASEPQIRQPLSMSFDDRGRIWVIQYLQYPNYAGLKAVSVDQYLRTKFDRVPEPPPKGPRGADRITILEDKDGDGRYETTKDFVTGLNIASGMALGHGGVFVAQPPYLLFYADKNGDDIPDGDPEVLLTGFGMEDTHSLANSLQWGPDGWLYGAAGSTSTCKIRGIEFQQGIWRYHPITKEFELFAEGGGNTWGLDFDRHGNAIAGTNFGGNACLHQVQGGYYIKGFGKHGPLHNPNTFGYFEHIPYKDFKGGHVTCGGTIYQGGAFPSTFDNTYIACNPLSNVLNWHVLEPKGSTFTAHHGGEFLSGNDPWFRPIDTLVGPDGALYVVDWYDARLNHVDPRDNWDRRNGRIYRVQPKDNPKATTFNLARLRSSQILPFLSHKNEWYRQEARLILAERRDPTVIPALRKLIDENVGDLALEALWALHVSGGFDDSVAESTLSHPNADVRAWTVRLLGDPKAITRATLFKLLQLAIKETSPTVRSQLACTAKRLPVREALPLIRELLRRSEDADDPFIPLLLWWALEDKAVSAREEAISLFDKSDLWSSPVATKYIVDRLARRYMSEGGVPGYASCARLLALAPDETALLKVVDGMEQALEGRRLEAVPAPLKESLATLWKTHGQNMKVLRLALRLGSPEAFESALRRVEETKSVELVNVLGQSGKPEVVPVLLKLLAEGRTDALLQAVLAALQPFQNEQVASAVLVELPRLTGPSRVRARSLLFSRPASALEFLKLVDAGKIPPKEVPLDQLSALMDFKDEAVGKLVEKHWGKVGAATPGEKRAQIGSIKNILSHGKGDAARGKVHFMKVCGVCHTLFGEGNKIGPELDGQDRKNLDLLLTNIVDPSVVIRAEFQARKIRTTDGQVITGLLVEQSAGAVTILDAQNIKTTIARSRIDALVDSEVSLMPEKLLDPLTDPEIQDLFAYLQGDKGVQGILAKPPLKVCLVSGSLEYESDTTLAGLQEHLEKHFNVKCSRAFRKTDEDMPGLEALETSDVMVLYTRRLKLPSEQLNRVKRYCEAGRPIVALRTASHAFQTWLALDKEILGGNYSNHYGKGPDCRIEATEKGKTHPILDGVTLTSSESSLYQNPKIAEDCDVLLTGSIPDHTEPLAWTRLHNGGRVFYTSLGDQQDFNNPDFVRMIENAILWTAAGPKKPAQAADKLSGTAPLEGDHDFGAEMVAGIDKFLLREIDLSVERRAKYWKRDTSSEEAYQKSVTPNRERLKKLIGVVDARTSFDSPELVGSITEPALVGKGRNFEAYAIRWPVFRGVHGEGLLLLPTNWKDKESLISVVAIPDADQTPEMIAGLVPGLPLEKQFARCLAENGCRVVIPTLIDRSDSFSVSSAGRSTNQPHREFVYRPAFEMGRHVIGYEVQKVLAIVDWFDRTSTARERVLAVWGWGEGGLLALHAGAVDPRIGWAGVGGYLESRQNAWKEPIYRNVFGLLTEFGDADLASLTQWLGLPSNGVDVEVFGPPAPRQGRGGAAPGTWKTPPHERTVEEGKRYASLVPHRAERDGREAITAFSLLGLNAADARAPEALRKEFDSQKRLKRQFDELVEDTQVLLRQTEKVREGYFWKRTDKKSVEGWEKSTAPLRDEFYGDVIGKFDDKPLPPNPKSRRLYEEATYTAYEVQLDLWKDVFAYGWLLVPKNIKEGEKRPVVVCQHGLEGRPADVADPKKNNPAYERYACRLAERGFVVFAPQNPYIGQDKFRTLQRKANLLGKHLFSFIIPQHQAITDWLASLPYVDPERIAFYGLSYGGKTAMRVPAVVTRYCLSICSADFNDWIWKNAATDSPYSYVTTGEYEIFEWNLGNTFNYAEMAALIAPRPFMVERGHFDGVAPDERVAYEYAKIKRFYDELKIGDRTEMEVFTGPHKINGVGTFDFLHKHLKWPKPESK